MQPALAQAGQERPPAGAALPVGQVHPQHLAAALPVHADRHQHRLAGDHAPLAHPLVASVQDQVGERLGQPPREERLQALVQPRRRLADRRGREAVTAQLLGDRLHLPRRHPLHVHFRQRRHQRLLRALVALEQLGREPPGPVLRNPQLQHPDPRHQPPLVVARPVTQPPVRPLALLGLQRFGHLRLQDLLQRRLQNRPKAVLVRQQQGLEVHARRRNFSLGHGTPSSSGIGDSNITLVP